MAEWTEAESSLSGPIISETEPSNPSKGDEWVDESYRSPAKKIYMGDGKWTTLISGNNVPPEQTYAGEETVDVSDISSTVEVRLTGDSGSGFGGSGGRVIAAIDLSYFETLEVQINPGKEGDRGYGTIGYRGGDGVMLKTGSGQNLVGAGGGGGGTREYDGANMAGGKGGSPNGGEGAEIEYNRGKPGGAFVANHPAVSQKSSGTGNGSPNASLFTGG